MFTNYILDEMDEVSMTLHFDKVWDPAFADKTSSEYEELKTTAQTMVRRKTVLFYDKADGHRVFLISTNSLRGRLRIEN